MSITELYATEEKLDAAYREIARLKAELEQAEARCGELADVAQRAMRWMTWNVDYGHMVDWFHRGKRALANPDTKKALALRQAQERAVTLLRRIDNIYANELGEPDEDHPMIGVLNEMDGVLDALREVEERG